VPLHMDGAREHFDAGNPDRCEGAAIRRYNLTCFHTPAGKPFGQRRRSIVPRAQRGHGGRLQTAPNIFPGFSHIVVAVCLSRRSSTKADDRQSKINQIKSLEVILITEAL
jgi:hypothetical protein